MELLKELFDIYKVKKNKKNKDGKKTALGMVPVASFVGNTVMSGEGEAMSESKKMTVKIAAPKPRNKQVNDVLRSKKGGRMKSPKDFDRNAAKRDTRNAMMEAEDEDCCYFWYSAVEEVKNRGGVGPDAADRRHDHVIKAANKEEARALVKRRHPKAYDIQVGPTSKERYEKDMDRDR